MHPVKTRRGRTGRVCCAMAVAWLSLAVTGCGDGASSPAPVALPLNARTVVQTALQLELVKQQQIAEMIPKGDRHAIVAVLQFDARGRVTTVALVPEKPLPDAAAAALEQFLSAKQFDAVRDAANGKPTTASFDLFISGLGKKEEGDSGDDADAAAGGN